MDDQKRRKLDVLTDPLTALSYAQQEFAKRGNEDEDAEVYADRTLLLAACMRSISSTMWIRMLREGTFTFECLVALSRTCRAMDATVSRLLPWSKYLDSMYHAELTQPPPPPWRTTESRVIQFALARKFYTVRKFSACGICFVRTSRWRHKAVSARLLVLHKCQVDHCFTCLEEKVRRAMPERWRSDAILAEWYFSRHDLHRVPRQDAVPVYPGELSWPANEPVKIRETDLYWYPEVDEYHRQIVAYLLNVHARLDPDASMKMASVVDVRHIFNKRNRPYRDYLELWQAICTQCCVHLLLDDSLRAPPPPPFTGTD